MNIIQLYASTNYKMEAELEEFDNSVDATDKKRRNNDDHRGL